MNDSVKEMLKIFKSKGVEINIFSDFNEIYVRANDLLNNVIDNLLINAIKHNNSPKIKIDIQLEIIEKKFIHKIREVG